MARNRHASPAIQIAITQEQYDRAVQSDSGGCLIADAIRAQYPKLNHVSVDMATIRVTDPDRDQRYIYLTPPAAQHALLSFDQGWPNPVERITIKGAVQILPVKRYTSARRGMTADQRAARIAELTARRDSGEEPLTHREKIALARMTATDERNRTRPSTTGPADVEIRQGRVTVRGGPPIPQGPAHPNLLRGRDRHFGAKLADPGVAFSQAVEAAVAERLAAGSPS